ncbi:cdc42 effector protein 4 [Betta splendens]|uniref:Cdc42 effector protein 4 n=1 Tax=Betta splendens TaxID=158456 RepID=A0A6P7L6B9_BETSP|nr:cdc42 effector protein 4 [Betta splendens]
MPILKQLVNNSSQSKRRSRVDLTAEMISAPLGDFRHTMHVGRGGDAFGDTSFLSTRSGEAPREAEAKQGSPGSKPGLLSRTFRSSKRSHSVNRGDNMAAPPAASSSIVKNAISLPYLNDEDPARGKHLPKSASSSPMKKIAETESRALNGAAAMATLDAELHERSFGELTDLPPSVPKGGGMKHAESMMSFHIDLGPSMLGDILSVMEKKGCEEDDLGFEEGRGSEGHASPSHIPHIDDDDAELLAPARPPRGSDPHAPQPRARNGSGPRDPDSCDPDSCSASSAGSAADDQPRYRLHDGDADSAKYSSPRGDEEFTFMDEDEEDEIRV